MTIDKKFYVQGCGWVSSHGYGVFGAKPRFTGDDAEFQYPDLQEHIPELPPRFGRFDVYTKVCFSAAVLALKDAGFQQRKEKENIGIVAGSRTGVYDNDISFFQSTQEQNGAFSSPNLFSYTLPNVALGEIAVFFGLTGPSFCAGNDAANPGMEALSASLTLLESKQCPLILVGWIEVAKSTREKERFNRGAAFALLSLEKTSATKSEFSPDKMGQFSDLFEK